MAVSSVEQRRVVAKVRPAGGDGAGQSRESKVSVVLDPDRQVDRGDSLGLLLDDRGARRRTSVAVVGPKWRRQKVIEVQGSCCAARSCHCRRCHS